jgi:hypothetical protein
MPLKSPRTALETNRGSDGATIAGGISEGHSAPRGEAVFAGPVLNRSAVPFLVLGVLPDRVTSSIPCFEVAERPNSDVLKISCRDEPLLLEGYRCHRFEWIDERHGWRYVGQS